MWSRKQARLVVRELPCYLVHTTIPNYNWVKRLSADVLCWNCKSFYEVNQKFKRFLLFFSIPHHTKRKPRVVAKSCTYRCVPRFANPLYSLFLNSRTKKWHIGALLATLFECVNLLLTGLVTHYSDQFEEALIKPTKHAPEFEPWINKINTHVN